MSKDTSKNINKKGEKEGTERNERDVFYLVPPNVDEEETALRTSNTSSETLRSPFNTKSSSSSPSTLRSPFNTKSSSSPSASRTSLSNTKSSSSPSASRTSLSNTKSSSNIIKSKLAGLQVKILKIHLPKLMILDESQVEATETLRSLEKNLSNFDLKEFRKENNRLYKRIDFYKNLQMPRSMKKSSKPKRKHQRNNDSEDSDDEIIDVDVKMNEKDEKDDKDARVSNILTNEFMLIFTKFFITVNNLDGNEDHFENYACHLDYDQTFMSKTNVDIRKQLIPELMKSLKLNFNPTYNKLTKWLMLLHKSR
ncbi:hypothetical protein RhiirA5_435868 [Rhizophagus irregularis]|uniref:Uncharacterized protein n=1 Tax=Rhizophagus irregularis TaxID=588596 RepID=A0A2N0NMR1_9GLOM|nr:hypothetical protein RhiirA5_435868 [Rhizophagus irregularis]